MLQLFKHLVHGWLKHNEYFFYTYFFFTLSYVCCYVLLFKNTHRVYYEGFILKLVLFITMFICVELDHVLRLYREKWRSN